MYILSRVNRTSGEINWLSNFDKWRTFEEINNSESEKFKVMSEDGASLWLTAHLKRRYGSNWKKQIMNEPYNYNMVEVN